MVIVQIDTLQTSQIHASVVGEVVGEGLQITMANGLNRLTARAVANLAERGRYSDGGGLYLTIDGKAARQWAFRFQMDGKRSEMMLGRGVCSSGQGP